MTLQRISILNLIMPYFYYFINFIKQSFSLFQYLCRILQYNLIDDSLWRWPILGYSSMIISQYSNWTNKTNGSRHVLALHVHLVLRLILFHLKYVPVDISAVLLDGPTQKQQLQNVINVVQFLQSNELISNAFYLAAFSFLLCSLLQK